MRLYSLVVLIVRRCPGCGIILDRRSWDRSLRVMCSACVQEFQAAGAVSVSGVDMALAVWQYNEDLAPLIGMAKGPGGPSIMRRLAPPLARSIRPYRQASSVVTWVPPSPRGRRRRGFDQGRVLASAVAARLELPARPAFTRSGRAQQGRSRSIRLDGPRLRIRPDWSATPTQIILVDDVITTGTSMATAARLLREQRSELDVVGAALSVRL